MGMFFHDRGEAPPERPSDPELRRANLRRIRPLFKPYWRRLSVLLGLIVLSAGLGVVPAFLLRRVLVAITQHDTRAISFNAGGMIVIAVISGVLGVIQTLLSNQVGQRVMHDLRAAVFRHLQRLSLAFFTRTGSSSARRWAAAMSSQTASRPSLCGSPTSRCASGWRAAG
jgi:ATP-binding cassette, subfamily B, bacterial